MSLSLRLVREEVETGVAASDLQGIGISTSESESGSRSRSTRWEEKKAMSLRNKVCFQV
jgi:hypothetical protein